MMLVMEQEMSFLTLIGDVDFRAGGTIVLTDGFHAQSGSSFHAYIAPKWCEIEREEFATQADFDDNWNAANNLNYGARGTAYKSRVTINTGNGGEVNISIEGDQDDCNSSSHCYETGHVTSKRHFHTSNEPYGRYDISLWSAADNNLNTSGWLLTRVHPSDNSVPRYMDEFDVMEHFVGVPTNGYNQAYHLWHGQGEGPMEHQHVGKIATYPGLPDFISDWRVYSLEIEPDEIRWLVDDCVVFRLPGRDQDWGYDFAARVLKEPFHWLFTAAVEGLLEPNRPGNVTEYSFDIGHIAVFDKLVKGEDCPTCN